jgi:hypothetical protein
MPTAVLYSWWWVRQVPETCKNLTVKLRYYRRILLDIRIHIYILVFFYFKIITSPTPVSCKTSLSFRFTHQNLYVFQFSPIPPTHFANLIPLDCIIRIMFCDQYTSYKAPPYASSPSSCFNYFPLRSRNFPPHHNMMRQKVFNKNITKHLKQKATAE